MCRQESHTDRNDVISCSQEIHSRNIIVFEMQKCLGNVVRLLYFMDTLNLKHELCTIPCHLLFNFKYWFNNFTFLFSVVMWHIWVLRAQIPIWYDVSIQSNRRSLPTVIWRISYKCRKSLTNGMVWSYSFPFFLKQYSKFASLVQCTFYVIQEMERVYGTILGQLKLQPAANFNHCAVIRFEFVWGKQKSYVALLII